MCWIHDACVADPAHSTVGIADDALQLGHSRPSRERGWMVGSELPYLHFRGPELAGLTLG